MRTSGRYATEAAHRQASTKEGWAKLSPEVKVAVLVDLDDQIRLDESGGYPSEYDIENGKVYRADCDENSEPSLEIVPIQEFIKDHEWLVTEDWEQSVRA